MSTRREFITVLGGAIAVYRCPLTHNSRVGLPF